MNGAGAALVLVSYRGESPEVERRGRSDEGGQMRAFAILLVAMMLGGLVYRGATVIQPTYVQLKNGGIFQALAGWFGGGLTENVAATAIASGAYLLGMQPVENTLVARFTPRRFHHAAFGTKFVLTFGVGALAVKGVAAIEGAAGLEAVFPSLGAVSVLMVGVILLLRWQVQRQPAMPDSGGSAQAVR